MRIHIIINTSLLLLMLGCPFTTKYAHAKVSPSSTWPHQADYTLLWWAEGPPRILNTTPSNGGETLCFQSGTWGLAFDANRVMALRAGRWKKPMDIARAMFPGRTSLSDLPSVAWDCAVIVGHTRYACVGHVTESDSFYQPVRFVESGRYFQRVDIEGLRFIDSDGNELPCDAHMEISAWPDRLAFHLAFTTQATLPQGEVILQMGDHRVSASLTKSASLTIVYFDNNGVEPKLTADPALRVGANETLGCQTMLLPDIHWSNPDGTSYPAGQLDALDRWSFTLRNDSGKPTIARLMFIQENPPSITGFTPMLCEPNGAPSGLPLQISKNWHQSPSKGTLRYQGPWFHGFAYVRLEAHTVRKLLLQMVYARYGGLFAASFSQLSLIGWGHNQFWNEAAIGSFGENICFEPGRVQRRCFIDDMRPLMTLSHTEKAKSWSWADNCGGGDFLMWIDPEGNYQPMCATRTDYRSYGPCLTDTLYTEESTGDEIASHMEISIPRSQDYLRIFIHLRYDVRKPMSWKRLAFFQLGADYYNETPARKVAIGNATGMIKEWNPIQSNDIYDKIDLPLMGNQPWISIHGVNRADLSPGQAFASRGLIVRRWRAELGGKPAPNPCASFYCTEWGKGNYRTTIELSPPASVRELMPGDFVDADLELVVFPADASDYYGPDIQFRTTLEKEANTWLPVFREAAGNNIKVQAGSGVIMKSYPLMLEVDRRQRAEVTIYGGVGFLPVTFNGLDQPQGYHLYVNGFPLNQSVHGNDYWQTDYDSSSKKWRRTYNIPTSAGGKEIILFKRDK